jgi:hypothetical protein
VRVVGALFIALLYIEAAVLVALAVQFVVSAGRGRDRGTVSPSSQNALGAVAVGLVALPLLAGVLALAGA